MAFFDDLKQKVMSGSRQVSDKAKEMADIAKLKSQIVAEKNKIKAAYGVLGELYYNAHKDEPESEEFAAQTEAITAALAAIENFETEIERIKAAASEPAVVEPVEEPAESVETLIEEAEEALEQLEEGLGKSLDEAEKTEEPVDKSNKVCPICGAEMSYDASFCSKCGYPMI